MRNLFRRTKRAYAIVVIQLGTRQQRVPLPDAWTVCDFEEYVQEAFDNRHPALYLPSRGGGLIVLPRMAYTRATYAVWGPEHETPAPPIRLPHRLWMGAESRSAV